ncbi:hypothetical protein JW752_04620 [Candidatus Peregrinibacteria bacterium]|nr:hypothetical protein [Candidatus Peregrinibacteria bacterium]
MPDDSQEQLREQQLKSALGMSASSRYEGIEEEKMEKTLVAEGGKVRLIRGLKPDEKSIEKTKEKVRETAEDVARGLTPLSPIDQQKTVKTQNLASQGTGTTQSTASQSITPAIPQAPSTRDNQKQINRVDNKGQKIQPRLAESARVQPRPPAIPPPTIGGAVKKTAAKALPIAAPLLSGIGGAITAYFIA